jgi:5'-phosphate synthase pdxT subunit
MTIGILAVQGNYEAHARVLTHLNVAYQYIYKPDQLDQVQGLILPGGESTTMLHFLEKDGFLEAIQHFAKSDRPILGTCAGAILLAKEVSNPTQSSLQLVDVSIARNAYGRQVASCITYGEFQNVSEPLEMVFIRAPKITRVGPNVTVFATYQGDPVGVSEGQCYLTTFHPELSADNFLIHRLFLQHYLRE